MNPYSNIQNWYHSQCNGDWENSYGIKIGNLDNPGWDVKIDLIDTELEDAIFREISYGVDDDGHDSDDNWMICKRVGNTFEGFGGTFKLDEILQVFLDWANKKSKEAEQVGAGDAEESV